VGEGDITRGVAGTAYCEDISTAGRKKGGSAGRRITPSGGRYKRATSWAKMPENRNSNSMMDGILAAVIGAIAHDQMGWLSK
jgi:hypothetical protein